jgi:hypothetical protein
MSGWTFGEFYPFISGGEMRLIAKQCAWWLGLVVAAVWFVPGGTLTARAGAATQGALLPAVGFSDVDSTEFPTPPIILDADSAARQPSPPIPVERPKVDTSFWRKPTGTLFKSVLFPGWGQYANGKYQKAAIIFGIESFFIYKSVQYFRKTRDRFDTFQQTGERDDFDAYDNARSTRNKYYWFVAGTIFFSMWDAYADAHLKPFEDVEDDDEFWGVAWGKRRRSTRPEWSLGWTIRY